MRSLLEAPPAQTEPPPLPQIELIGERRRRESGERNWLGYLVAALGGGGLAWLAAAQGWLG